MSGPRIVDRRQAWASQYLHVVEKDVDFGGGRGVETYWSVRTGDYAVILAVTHEGLIPLVRQYRPAVEAYVLELPSGAIDADETPETAGRRELFEETGCQAGELAILGQLHVDTGRLETQQWAFFAPDVRIVNEGPTGEEELELLFVSPSELRESILAGDFDLSLHVATVGLAVFSGYLAL